MEDIIILYVIFLVWTFSNLFTERTYNCIDKCIDTMMNRLPVFVCVLLAFLKYFFLSMLTPAIVLGLVYYCIIQLK